MKIEKAVKLLEELKEGLDLPLMTDEEDALKLGIEAMKRVAGNRKYPQPTVYPLLPGETED